MQRFDAEDNPTEAGNARVKNSGIYVPISRVYHQILCIYEQQPGVLPSRQVVFLANCSAVPVSRRRQVPTPSFRLPRMKEGISLAETPI